MNKIKALIFMKDFTSKHRKSQSKKRNQEKNCGLRNSIKLMLRVFYTIIIIQLIHLQFLISKMKIIISYLLKSCRISHRKIFNRKQEEAEAHK
jgi:hypothetical protein